MADGSGSWSVLRSFMQERCGVVLAEDQHYLMEARLAPVAKQLKFVNVDQYVLEACKPGAPRHVSSPLIDAMTTHETYFFRDTPFWKALSELVVPKILAAGDGTIRIWSAACSTGQEPYTLAMVLTEQFPQFAPRCHIVATDISEGVLETAKKGSYTVFEANRGITAPRLMKHFEKDGANFKVKESLRRMVSWSTQNLITGPSPSGLFDIVMVRNVLIYFPEGPRQQVVTRLRQALKPTGFLGLGTTEFLGGGLGTALAPGWFPAR